MPVFRCPVYAEPEAAMGAESEIAAAAETFLAREKAREERRSSLLDRLAEGAAPEAC